MATTIRMTTTKGRLQEIAKDLQNTLAELADDASDHAPIARITIGKSGAIFGPQHLYAPGLPPGEHDLWCVPVRAAAQPAGDAAMSRDELQDQWSLIIQSCIDVMPDGHMAKYATAGHPCGSPLPVAVAALTERIAILERERDHANDLASSAMAGIAPANERIAGLEADLVEERNRIASMRTEWGAEVAALTERVQFHVSMTRDAQEAASAAQAQARHAEAEAAKSERRAIEFGDALHRNILAMRAAFVAWCRGEASDGMGWVANTLAGPGHIPGESEVALGAQALFDKEVAEQEAFRSAKPGPASPAPAPATRDADAIPPSADTAHVGVWPARMRLPGQADDAAAPPSAEPASADEAGLTACVTCGAPAGVYADPAPIDMVLHCPNYGAQHIDKADAPITVLEAVLRANPLAMPAPAHWTNPPHRSHQCHYCNGADGGPFVWRPADVPTNGVVAVKTRGNADSPTPAPCDTAAMLAQLMDRVAEYGSACVQEDRNDRRRGHESQAGHPEYDLQAMLSEIEASAKRMLGIE